MPTTAPSFADLGLCEPIRRALGPGTFPHPTPIQRRIVPVMLAGRDLVAVAEPGSGKTIAWQLGLLHRLVTPAVPAAAREPRALVIAPDGERATAIGIEFEQRARFAPVRHVVAVQGTNWNHQEAELKNGVEVLIATPLQILELLRQRALILRAVEFAVLDDADQLLDEDAADRLAVVLAELPERRQTAILATAAPIALRDLSVEWLRDPIGIRLGEPAVTPRAAPADLTRPPVEPPHVRDDFEQEPPDEAGDLLLRELPVDLTAGLPIELPAWLDDLPPPESLPIVLPSWLDDGPLPSRPAAAGGEGTGGKGKGSILDGSLLDALARLDPAPGRGPRAAPAAAAALPPPQPDPAAEAGKAPPRPRPARKKPAGKKAGAKGTKKAAGRKAGGKKASGTGGGKKAAAKKTGTRKKAAAKKTTPKAAPRAGKAGAGAKGPRNEDPAEPLADWLRNEPPAPPADTPPADAPRPDAPPPAPTEPGPGT